MKNQADDQILKMYHVTRQMRSVFDSLKKNQLNLKLDRQILTLFVKQLDSIRQHAKILLNQDSQSISANNTFNRRNSSISSHHKNDNQSLSNDKIPQSATSSIAIAQEIHQSQSQQMPKKVKQNAISLNRTDNQQKQKSKIQIRLSNQHIQDSNHMMGSSGEQIDITQLVQLNHELSQQNDYLTRKVQQLEEQMNRIKQQIQIYHLNKKKNNISNNSGRRFYEQKNQQSLWQLQAQLVKVTDSLKQSEQYIQKMNQQFVRQVQKYNQRIWIYQRQIEKYKKQFSTLQQHLDEQDVVVQRLRQQNFSLNVTIRQSRNPIKIGSSTNFTYLNTSQNNNLMHQRSPSPIKIVDNRKIYKGQLEQEMVNGYNNQLHHQRKKVSSPVIQRQGHNIYKNQGYYGNFQRNI